MWSSFHPIPGCYGRTDIIVISISRVSVLTRDKNCWIHYSSEQNISKTLISLARLRRVKYERFWLLSGRREIEAEIRGALATLTRRALNGVHVPPTKMFRRLTASVTETIVKPRIAAVVGHKSILKTTPLCSDQYVYIRFSRCKILRTSAYTIAEKAIQFRHLDHNPDRDQKLTSSSMSPTSINTQHFIHIHARIFEQSC